ncbi:hypothetical protein ABK040_005198 [Willaertia magna]
MNTPVFPLLYKAGAAGVIIGSFVFAGFNGKAISQLIDNNMKKSKEIIEERRIRVLEEEERIKQRKLEFQLLSYAGYGRWNTTKAQAKYLQDKLEHKERNNYQDLLVEYERKVSEHTSEKSKSS